MSVAITALSPFEPLPEYPEPVPYRSAASLQQIANNPGTLGLVPKTYKNSAVWPVAAFIAALVTLAFGAVLIAVPMADAMADHVVSALLAGIANTAHH